ncbi:MAG: signal peptidase II [Actinobacteria bacterium]|nr:signal peptidase II [Actinomycetota bacterium]
MSARAPLNKAAAGAIIASLAVLVLAADQFTKFLAIGHLPSEEPVPIFGDFLIFYLVRNPGAAFSLGTDVTWVFTIALSLVAIAIIVLIWRIRSRAWAIVLGMLLGGVLGNLTDRLFRPPSFGSGHVVDFISTPWMMPAIYNVADMFIVTMMISVALLVLLGLRLDGTREPRRNAPPKGEDTILGADGDEVPPGGGVQGVGDSPFPVADPDAGAPRDR